MSETTKKQVGADPDAPDPAHLLAMIQELQSKCQQLEADKRTAGAGPLISTAESSETSETSDEAPQLYKFMGAYGQVRVRNLHPTFQLRSPWIAKGMKQYAILSSEDVHPRDLAHLLRATVTVRRLEMDKYGSKRLVAEQAPILVPIDAPA